MLSIWNHLHVTISILVCEEFYRIQIYLKNHSYKSICSNNFNMYRIRIEYFFILLSFVDIVWYRSSDNTPRHPICLNDLEWIFSCSLVSSPTNILYEMMLFDIDIMELNVSLNIQDISMDKENVRNVWKINRNGPWEINERNLFMLFDNQSIKKTCLSWIDFFFISIHFSKDIFCNTSFTFCDDLNKNIFYSTVW